MMLALLILAGRNVLVDGIVLKTLASKAVDDRESSITGVVIVLKQANTL